ncbi:unnamed protein product [Nippostrongylus brasiliensis]|uniref:ELM2 domain-containing protein n=1 Tax=Nippostrongylus brasiliensis TaxID=27835 RepID=A0A0N4XXY3_NIPBR|nr:unnamed protein product [Nippostrongylus brasiliensis]
MYDGEAISTYMNSSGCDMHDDLEPPTTKKARLDTSQKEQIKPSKKGYHGWMVVSRRSEIVDFNVVRRLNFDDDQNVQVNEVEEKVGDGINQCDNDNVNAEVSGIEETTGYGVSQSDIDSVNVQVNGSEEKVDNGINQCDNDSVNQCHDDEDLTKTAVGAVGLPNGVGDTELAHGEDDQTNAVLEADHSPNDTGDVEVLLIPSLADQLMLLEQTQLHNGYDLAQTAMDAAHLPNCPGDDQLPHEEDGQTENAEEATNSFMNRKIKQEPVTPPNEEETEPQQPFVYTMHKQIKVEEPDDYDYENMCYIRTEESTPSNAHPETFRETVDPVPNLADTVGLGAFGPSMPMEPVPGFGDGAPPTEYQLYGRKRSFSVEELKQLLVARADVEPHDYKLAERVFGLQFASAVEVEEVEEEEEEEEENEEDENEEPMWDLTQTIMIN